MPRTPAALALAACLALAGLAPAHSAAPGATAWDAATGAAPNSAAPSALPDMPLSASPDSARLPEDAATKPYVPKPRAAKPAPARADLTFALKPGPTGFRGLPWGATLSEGKTQLGLVPVTQPVALPGAFQREGELLKVGLADVRTIAYYFPKGRFVGVGIVFEGEANFFLIKDHLIELYGPGRQVADRYGWTWKDCNIDLRLRGSVGELRYTYEP